jgi:type IV pilus assembly protein PilY1
MELDTFSGGRLSYAVFDLDVDGDFDMDDWITVDDGTGNPILIPASGIDPEIGIVQTPAVLSGIGADNDEVKVLSGSSGELIGISELGGIGIGRQSWRQLR